MRPLKIRIIILALVIWGMVFCDEDYEYEGGDENETEPPVDLPPHMSPQEFKDSFVFTKKISGYMGNRMKKILPIILDWWDTFNRTEQVTIHFHKWKHNFTLSKDGSLAFGTYDARKPNSKSKQLKVAHRNGSFILHNVASHIVLALSKSVYVLTSIKSTQAYCGPLRVFRNTTVWMLTNGDLISWINEHNYTEAFKAVDNIVDEFKGAEPPDKNLTELYQLLMDDDDSKVTQFFSTGGIMNSKVSDIKEHYKSFFKGIPTGSFIGFLHHFTAGLAKELVADLGVFFATYAFSMDKGPGLDTVMNVADENATQPPTY